MAMHPVLADPKASDEEQSREERAVTAKQIKALRTKTGLSQSRFAELIGVHATTVVAWETGRRTPQILYHAVLDRFYKKTGPMSTVAVSTTIMEVRTSGGIFGLLEWIFK